MAKPILIVRTSAADENTLIKVRRNISAMTNHEYHVLVVIKADNAPVTFETHNAENLDPKDLKELQQLISDANNQANQKVNG